MATVKNPRKNGNGNSRTVRGSRQEVDFWNCPLSARKVRRALKTMNIDPEAFRALYVGDKSRPNDITPNQREAVKDLLAGKIDILTAKERCAYKGAEAFLNLVERVQRETIEATPVSEQAHS